MNRLTDSLIKDFEILQTRVSAAAASSKSAKEYDELEPYQLLTKTPASKLRSIVSLLGVDSEALAIIPLDMGNNAWNAKSQLQILKICVDSIGLSLITKEEDEHNKRQYLLESGKALTAHDLISQILKSANTSIKIVDNYLSEDTAYITETYTNANTSVRILTTENNKRKIADFLEKVKIIKKGWKAESEVRKSTTFHDRYIIIDDNKVWFSGPSLDALGIQRPGVICEISDIKDEIISQFNEAWDAANTFGE